MAGPKIADLAYRALASALGGPVDLATMAMRPLGYKTPDEKVIGGSEWIGSKLEQAGLVSQARDPLKEFAASMMVPSPSGLGVAAGKGAAMIPAVAGMFVGKGAKSWDALKAEKALAEQLPIWEAAKKRDEIAKYIASGDYKTKLSSGEAKSYFDSQEEATAAEKVGRAIAEFMESKFKSKEDYEKAGDAWALSTGTTFKGIGVPDSDIPKYIFESAIGMVPEKLVPQAIKYAKEKLGKSATKQELNFLSIAEAAKGGKSGYFTKPELTSLKKSYKDTGGYGVDKFGQVFKEIDDSAARLSVGASIPPGVGAAVSGMPEKMYSAIVTHYDSRGMEKKINELDAELAKIDAAYAGNKAMADIEKSRYMNDILQVGMRDAREEVFPSPNPNDFRYPQLASEKFGKLLDSVLNVPEQMAVSADKALTHDNLYYEYPHLKQVETTLSDRAIEDANRVMGEQFSGLYAPGGGGKVLAKNPDPASYIRGIEDPRAAKLETARDFTSPTLSTVLHEMQHAAQYSGGETGEISRYGGQGLDKAASYWNSSLEAQARQTQTRAPFTMEQRLANYPYDPDAFFNQTGVSLQDVYDSFRQK